MSYALFILPKNEILQNIIYWKKIINDSLPNQLFCSHPPHCTIIHTNLNNINIVIEKIKLFASNISSFQIDIVRPDVFWDDTLCNGYHTLHWKIDKNNEIMDLQVRLASTLSPYIERSVKPITFKEPRFSKSYDTYGFPFIGDHWIPHMTIASLSTSRKNDLINSFLNQDQLFKMNVDHIELWEIQNDDHKLMKKFFFK